MNFYQELVCFGKEVYKVNVRTGYLNKTAVQEIPLFLSKSMITENIMEPLNSGDRTYFSLLTDGSSSAKTMDKKELYVIKIRSNVDLTFLLLSSQMMLVQKALKKALIMQLRRKTYQLIGRLMKLDLAVAEQTQTKFCINLKKKK